MNVASGVGRISLRLLLILATSLAIVVVTLPVRSQAQPQKSSCCAHMSKPVENDCGHQPAKSGQDLQCCAACAVGLALFFAASTPFVFAQGDEENFAQISNRAVARFERPPVPPPRSSVA